MAASAVNMSKNESITKETSKTYTTSDLMVEDTFVKKLNCILIRASVDFKCCMRACVHACAARVGVLRSEELV